MFLCFLTALIPSVWHKLIIMPKLKEWDLKFASAEERQIARGTWTLSRSGLAPFHGNA